MKTAIGIDIGGTNTKIGVVREDSTLLSFDTIPTESSQPFDQFLIRLGSTLDALLKKNNLLNKDILAVGVGCPSVDARNGLLISPPNLGWRNLQIQKLLSESLPWRVELENDANVAAIGEKHWGVARGMEDFVVVTLGTGIGTGIFSGGKLLVGSNGRAGEGGHLTIEPSGRLCHCGKRGHLECYASVRGIKETVKEEMNLDLSFKEIRANYLSGDPAFIQVFEKTAEYLARGLAEISAILAPEAFILAGGIATVGEGFRRRVEEDLNHYLFPPFTGHNKVLISEIATEHGAILGAASLVLGG